MAAARLEDDTDAMKLVWERGADGKLTMEAKYQVEKLNKEQVMREKKKTGIEKNREEEAYVTLDSDVVLRKKAKGKLSWLQKAFQAMEDGRFTHQHIFRVYEILAAPTFGDDWHFAQSKKAFELLQDPNNLGYFTYNQQKFLQSNKFRIHKEHAVVNLISSEEDEPNTFGQPQGSDKPKWLIRKERRARGLPSDSDEDLQKPLVDAKKQKEAEERAKRMLAAKHPLDDHYSKFRIRPKKEEKEEEKKKTTRDRDRSRDRRKEQKKTNDSRNRSGGRGTTTRDKAATTNRGTTRNDSRSRSPAARRGENNYYNSRKSKKEDSRGRAANRASYNEDRTRGRRNNEDSRGRPANYKHDKAPPAGAAARGGRKNDSRSRGSEVEKETLEERIQKREKEREEKRKQELIEKKLAKLRAEEERANLPSSSSEDEDGNENDSDDDKKKGGKKVERRVDPADDNMYSLEEFCEAYGGTPQHPPRLWTQQRHTAFFFAN
ncbi:unnamed protein product [Amoebophrya sp. A120]|nr:unnamed protein product [Amoebophrya sp. A120]|eukprot:GSA120T00007977001.1